MRDGPGAGPSLPRHQPPNALLLSNTEGTCPVLPATRGIPLKQQPGC